MSDTIFALSSAPGRGAVAVVRVSGPDSDGALEALAGRPPAPRTASLRRLRDADGGVIDEALVLRFKAPASFTGEDSAELHVHGGRAVIDALTARLTGLGLRPAEPGEFTRRAFQNGKLDLTRAEAIADLVDAETEAQRRQALDQLGGALERRYERWREALIEVLALMEAEIDFPDEDVPDALASRTRAPLDGLIAELEAALGDAARGEGVRDGWRVAVVGAPNAGKSSLFNALVQRDAAIVTPAPGTTRDVIEAPLTLDGYRVLLADTAGVRETADVIEAEGVRRARAWAEGANLRLWVVDASADSGAWREAAGVVRAGDVLVLNKADREPGEDGAAAMAEAAARGLTTARVSVSTGEGLDGLRRALAARVVDALTGSEFPAVTRARHRARLEEARDALVRARTALSVGPELAAEDVRLAGRALGRVAGRIDAEDVLDVVFASFCIGK